MALSTKLYKARIDPYAIPTQMRRFLIQKHLFKKFNNIGSVFHCYEGIRVPRLWSAPINHYKMDKNSNKISIDYDKQSKHIEWISNYIDGHLINGSSGDGWELSMDDQINTIQNTLNTMINKPEICKPILFGCLQHTIDDKMTMIDQHISFLMKFYECDTEKDMLQKLYNDKNNPFVGFCINPTSNIDNDKEIEQGMEDILKKYENYPFAIYQIPQITNSEISSQSLYKLCCKYENLIILKDTSEQDNLIKSGEHFGGLFLIKGGDKNMINHLMPKNDGVLTYDGLMFSTANNYPVLLKQMMDNLCNDNNIENALKISKQITNLFESTFELAKDYSFGNPYTNCAKMVDYFMSFGAQLLQHKDKNIPITNKGVKYDEKELIKLHSILEASGDILTQNGSPYCLAKMN